MVRKEEQQPMKMVFLQFWGLLVNLFSKQIIFLFQCWYKRGSNSRKARGNFVVWDTHDLASCFIQLVAVSALDSQMKHTARNLSFAVAFFSSSVAMS